MSDSKPRIEQQPAPEGVRLRVIGQWTAAQFAQPGLLRALEGSVTPGVAQAGWDLRQAEQLDHIGAQWLWDHWGRQWPGQLELLPAQQAVLDRVARFTVQPRPPKRTSWWRSYLGLGAAVLGAIG